MSPYFQHVSNSVEFDAFKTSLGTNFENSLVSLFLQVKIYTTTNMLLSNWQVFLCISHSVRCDTLMK